jgi:hypothetical protein
MRDPYESLAVPRSATADDIKKSFRALAKRLHPDANNDNPMAAALFAELNAAHQILGDEEKRRAFDQGEIDAEGKPTHQVIAPARPSTWHIVTRLMVVMVMLATTAILIMRGLAPEEKINPNSDSGDSILSGAGAKEEQVRAARPELPEPGVKSEPHLILQQGVSYAAADGLPLGIQVDGEKVGLVLEISGLPSGTTISSGRQLGVGRWRILARDIGNAIIHPPPEFNGTIDLAIELRLIDDTIVDYGSLHLEWLQKPTIAPAPTEAVPAMAASEATGSVAPSESSADKALATAALTDQNAIQHAPESHRDHEPIELLIGRSEKLLGEGNVEAARFLLQPAAEAHNARAALALGTTYDPIMLAILQARGVTADASLAFDWYRKAQQFGSQEAQQRLRLLTTASTEPKRRVVRAPIHAAVSRVVGTHVEAPRVASPARDPDGVSVPGDRAGAVPDRSIRAQLVRLPALSGVGY